MAGRIGIITGPIGPRENRLMFTGLVNSQWVQAGRYHSSTSTSSSMWGQVPRKRGSVPECSSHWRRHERGLHTMSSLPAERGGDLPPRSALPGCETSCEQDWLSNCLQGFGGVYPWKPHLKAGVTRL